MNITDIFKASKPETIHDMIQWFRDNQRGIYTQAINGLVAPRKLRPVIVTRKSAPEQIDWIYKALLSKSSSVIGENLVQVWLMEAKKDLLAAFCDGVGIENKDGSVEGELPEELDSVKVKNTVDELLGKFNHDVVRIYLHAFNGQRRDGWSALNEALEKNPKLQFGA